MKLSELKPEDIEMPEKPKAVLRLSDLNPEDVEHEPVSPSEATPNTLGAAAGAGVGLEGARKAVEATASPLKNAAADAEFRAIGGQVTDAGQDILKSDVLNRSKGARAIGRASLDLGGSGLTSDLAHADAAKASLPKDWFFKGQGAPESKQAAIVAKILEQKALKDAVSGQEFSFSGLPSRLAAKFGPGVAAKGLDLAGSVAEKAGSRVAKSLPIVGAIGAGLLGYQNARADDEGIPDAIASGVGSAALSADPTGLLDATPTGPKKGSPEAKIESGDRAGFILDRAPDRLKPVLQKAMKDGPSALAATHRILMQRDPEYRAAIEGQTE